MKRNSDLRKLVALEYGGHSAPIVSIKAEGETADYIVQEARRLGVFVAKDRHLLSLLSELPIESEIPEQLYRAVAVILSWAYWLKGMRPGDEKG